MNRIVLASSSPSRLMVLRNAGVELDVVKPDVDEDAIVADLLAASPEASPADIVCALAEAKAADVVARVGGTEPGAAAGAESGAAAGAESGAATGTEPGAAAGATVVIACDSMLLLDGELSGKPHTVDETVRRWRLQRGRAAELVTGHSITALSDAPEGTRSATAAISTTVRFGEPSDADVRAYAESGEPLGCAGAFTLEALGGWFIDGVDGDPSSVLGLSLPLIRRTLAGWGLDVSAFWNRASGAAG